MVKPLWAVTGIALLGTAGVVGAVVVVASSGGEEEVVQQVETPTPSLDARSTQTAAPGPLLATPAVPAVTPLPAGVTLYRWANLTVVTTPEQGVIIGPNFAGATRDQQMALAIGKIDPSDSRIFSQVLVDQSGRILEEVVLDEHRAHVEAVLATLRVSPFDRATAPWPYNGEPDADLARDFAGELKYIEPSPASGLYIGGGIADPGGPFITLQNERSKAFVQFKPEGPAFDTHAVDDEDKEVFDRWFASTQRCTTETAC